MSMKVFVRFWGQYMYVYTAPPEEDGDLLGKAHAFSKLEQPAIFTRKVRKLIGGVEGWLDVCTLYEILTEYRPKSTSARAELVRTLEEKYGCRREEI